MAVPVAYSQIKSASEPLLLPTNVAVDESGNLYVSETGRHRVWKIDPSGQMTALAGSGTQGFGGDGEAAATALLNSPQGLAAGAGKLYIADSHNHRVRCVDLTSRIVTTVAGNGLAGSGGDGGKAVDARLDLPVALAIGLQGELYVADAKSHQIRRIAANGTISTIAGTGVQGFHGDGDSVVDAILDSPGGIAVDASGNLLVSDTHNHRIRRIDATTGTITTLAGNGSGSFSGDSGLSTAAGLALPRGVSIDQQGNIYIADSANHRVRRIDGATGMISTLAGDGTQRFSGDGGSAANASLNGPAGVVAGSSTVVIADSGNNRVRQIAGMTIETIAGSDAKVASSVAIAGPATVTYGSGQLSVKLSSADATGSLRITDSDSGFTRELGVFDLSPQSVVVDLSALPAGKHALVASYSGDATHAPAISAPFALTVNPLVLTATVSPSSLVYGTSVPQFSGTLNGVLDRDLLKVTPRFSTDVGKTTDTGGYPISVSLEGVVAENYTVTTTPTLTVMQASSMTTLSATSAKLFNESTVESGQSVLITAHVASSTSGSPGGTVTIFDNGKLLNSDRLSTSSDLAISVSTLAVGTHSLSAVYAGDRNFSGSSSSSPKTITVVASGAGISEDFNISTTGATSANLVAGSTATFRFSVSPQSTLSSKVLLAASGLPAQAMASFSPASVPPGFAATVTMTISMPTAEVRNRGSMALAGMAIPLMLFFRQRRSKRGIASVLGFALLAGMLSGCGDRVFNGNGSTAAAKTYNVTVTGTATSATGAAIQHAVSFVLTVLPNS